MSKVIRENLGYHSHKSIAYQIDFFIVSVGYFRNKRKSTNVQSIKVPISFGLDKRSDVICNV